MLLETHRCLGYPKPYMWNDIGTIGSGNKASAECPSTKSVLAAHVHIPCSAKKCIYITIAVIELYIKEYAPFRLQIVYIYMTLWDLWKLYIYLHRFRHMASVYLYIYNQHEKNSSSHPAWGRCQKTSQSWACRDTAADPACGFSSGVFGFLWDMYMYIYIYLIYSHWTDVPCLNVSFSNRLLMQQRCHPLNQLDLQNPKPPFLQMLGMNIYMV